MKVLDKGYKDVIERKERRGIKKYKGRIRLKNWIRIRRKKREAICRKEKKKTERREKKKKKKKREEKGEGKALFWKSRSKIRKKAW